LQTSKREHNSHVNATDICSLSSTDSILPHDCLPIFIPSTQRTTKKQQEFTQQQPKILLQFQIRMEKETKKKREGKERTWTDSKREDLRRETVRSHFLSC
jgi:hypothetical protein